jgi:hypothetical protein
LLALATGAAAMPQSSNADIIWTDLSANPVVVGPLHNALFLIDTFPGNAELIFRVHSNIDMSRWVTAAQNAGYLRVKQYLGFLVAAEKSVVWNQAPGNDAGNLFGTVGAANEITHAPNSFENKYALFKFKDSTAGDALRYGWVQMSLFNSFSQDESPRVTIHGYAYDDGGVQLPAGVVPEPSAMGLAVLGALTLGASGVRSWRRKRDQAASAD